MADKTVILTTAVRCFLVNGTSWNPREGEGLNCFHEESNSWGIFSIKVCTSDSKIIGYLPVEISRITKYHTPRCYSHCEDKSIIVRTH